MKKYKIILSENNSYTVEAVRLYVDGGFSILVDDYGIVAIAPSSACVICLGDAGPR